MLGHSRPHRTFPSAAWYQTVNLDEYTRLLLAHRRFFDYPGLTSAYYVTIGSGSVRLAGDVRFRVLELQEQPGVALDGREGLVAL